MSEEAQKLLQQHGEAGARVLAAWFDDAKFRAAWAPQPDLFAWDTQKAISRICAARGETLSKDDLLLQLDRQGKLKLWEGGADGLLEELISARLELNPWAAVDRLKEVAGARLLLSRMVSIYRELERGEGMNAAREGLANALRDADFASGARARTVRESVKLAYQHATETDRKKGARTISKELDEATGGILDGVVWLLAASTSWGKSSFIVSVANRGFKDGRRPLIVSAEDPERMFGSRLILARKQVNALRLREARLLNDEHKKVRAALEEAEDVPWFLNAVGRSVEAVASDIRSLVASDQISFVMVDYVQAMRAAQAQQDRRNEVNYIGRVLTDAIKESGVGGILFSQLTQDSSSGKMKARESEDLHNAAEVLLFGTIDRETKVDGSGKKVGTTAIKKLWIDKNKEGPAKLPLELPWNEASACFISDYDTDDHQLALGLAPPPLVDTSYDDFDNQASA